MRVCVVLTLRIYVQFRGLMYYLSNPAISPYLPIPPPSSSHHNIPSHHIPGEQREDQLLALRQRPPEGVRASERGDAVRRGGREVGLQRRPHPLPRGLGTKQAEAHRAHGGHGEFFGGGKGGRGGWRGGGECRACEFVVFFFRVFAPSDSCGIRAPSATHLLHRYEPISCTIHSSIHSFIHSSSSFAPTAIITFQ